MRNAFLLALLMLGGIMSFAQGGIDDQVLENRLFKPYDGYFHQEREWVYTHLNKSAYIQGDDIWFTSYVLNPGNKRLNLTTSKLYIELWSPKKKMVSRKILYVNAGTTNHFIHLDDSLEPGSYCLRAYTSWMRNFYPENDLNTYVTVLGHDKLPETGSKIKQDKPSNNFDLPKGTQITQETRPDYDIQFLPEGGTFLEDVDNVLGVKATDPQGNGIKISGKIFTADNQEVVSFSTSETGMESITVPVSANQKYIAKVLLPDSTTRDLPLPNPESRGVSIHINSYLSGVVWFRVQTNESTRLLNKSYIVMIHANGVVFNSYRIRFSKENSIQFKIKRSELGNGILYATIFDENLVPVAERLFYNQNSTIRGNLTLKAESLTNDSVNVNVVITDSLSRPRSAKLSISVLPGATALNHFNNSLWSESILRPALRGNIENPDAYFEKNDTRHTVAIDNLLLTQGWRKYDWPTILKDTIRKFTYPFEEAFTIEGKVKNWLKNKPENKSRISLISPQNNIFLISPVDSLGTFKYDRVYLNDSTWIIAAASSQKGSNWNRVLQMTIPESIMGEPDIKPIAASVKKPGVVAEEIPQLTKGMIQLQEVVVTAQKKNPFSDNIYVGIMDRTFELTKENYLQFHNMEMLLLIQFNVRTEKTADGEYHFNMGRGSSSVSGKPGDPILMIDGMKVNEPSDILDFPIELVEAVAVNKDGFGGGMGGSNGTIAIKSRTTPLFDNNAEATNIRRLMVNGYAVPKKYFEPKYIIQPGTSDYDKYAAIFWKPDLITDNNNNASFRFVVPKEIKTIVLRVEGISFEGRIFLHEQTIGPAGKMSKNGRIKE